MSTSTLLDRPQELSLSLRLKGLQAFSPRLPKREKDMDGHRDIAHTGMFTDFLMEVITPTDVRRKTKHTREEVLRNDRLATCRPSATTALATLVSAAALRSRSNRHSRFGRFVKSAYVPPASTTTRSSQTTLGSNE